GMRSVNRNLFLETWRLRPGRTLRHSAVPTPWCRPLRSGDILGTRTGSWKLQKDLNFLYSSLFFSTFLYFCLLLRVCLSPHPPALAQLLGFRLHIQPPSNGPVR